MTDLRDAARQALEALKYSTPIPQNKLGHEAAITALRAALEQPEQEPELRELLIGAAAMAVAAERKGEYQGASWVADAVLEQQGKEKPRSATSHIGTYYGRKNPALEQPEQATGKESLQVGQEEPEGGWQSAPSPQVTQRIADMPMSEYRRGVNDGFKLGLREGRIKAEDEMREQPEQEPVAWMDPNSGEVCRAHWLESHAPERDVDRFSCPLYTHPPRREWRSLSEEEIESLWRKWVGTQRPNYSFTRAVEAALRSKNHE
jgi:hypothetical protein